MSAKERPATRLWREALVQLEVLQQQPSEQREKMLKDIGRTQPHLHSMLVSLLEAEAHAEKSGFLDPPRLNNKELGPGELLGPYRIRSQIGTGGMGEVWLASRDDGLYEGEVAIKTLHPYLGGGVLRDRFLREAQILGRLTHPNIARLLDAGVSGDVGVYLVIEYVRGAELDRWCDDRKLDIDARLKLFLDVCAAVSQAHTNLVVHRDIKPSNILVTESGQVKLLDFGVAKLLESEPGAERTELTRMSGRIFTPEYAAPEQVLGQQITTATDVYSLCVLLHVLMTGKRPFADVNPVAVERAVLHDDPVRASLAIAREPEAATARSTTSARLRRDLEGDLDNIIARGLRKAPGERYASVSALADDIQRHLAHQPILARPESVAARTRKFVRRHRLGVAASLLVVAAIVTSIAGIVWQAQVARTEARKATAIKDFVVGIFERNNTAHPDGASARKTTAEELLSQASSEIRDGLKDAPEVRTELLGLMGQLYDNMEMQKEALPLLEEQVAGQRRTLGNSHPDLAYSLAYLAHSQAQSGDYPGALRSATEAQEIFRAQGMESALEYAETYKTMKQAHFRLGNNQGDTQTNLVQAGLDLVMEYHPRNEVRVSMLAALSHAELVRGNHERSLAVSEEAVRLIESGVVEVDGHQRGLSYQAHSDKLNWASRNEEAERYMRKAIVEFERAGGPEHPHTSNGKRALGLLLAWFGRRAEAKSLLQSAFDTQQRVRGDEDAHFTALTRLDLGRVLVMRGEYVEGEAHLQRVIELWRISGAPIVLPRMWLARLRTEQGRFDLAAKDLEAIEEVVIKVHGAGSWNHAIALNRQGDLHLAQGQLREAQQFFDRTNKEAKELKGMTVNHAYARAGLLRIAVMRRDPEATRLARDLLAQIESAPARQEMPDEEAAANMLLGVALMNAGEVQQSQRYLEKAVAMRTRMDAPESPWLAEARLYLAQQRKLAGAQAEARNLVALATRAVEAQPTGPRYKRLLVDTRARVMATT